MARWVRRIPDTPEAKARTDRWIASLGAPPSPITVRRLARQMELRGVGTPGGPALYDELRSIGWWAVDLNNSVLAELRRR